MGGAHPILHPPSPSKQLRNSSLAVWVRDGETWKLIGYQPMPRA